MEERPDVLSVPVQALNAGEHPSVYVIDKDHKVEERPVKIGLETPNRAEITDGVREGELVFIGNRSQVRVGATVQTKMIDSDQTKYSANNG